MKLNDAQVRDLVWAWLQGGAREEVLFSDLTRVLVTQRRAWHSDRTDPRGDLRRALHQLAARGLVSLSPTTKNGRGGAPGLRIEVITPYPPMSMSTYEKGSEDVER